jgi:UDPglucose 6-dehydrogenase
VIGVGHVGLVTSATLAHLGHEVTAVDIDREKIEQLERGTTPFFEPGLEELIAASSAAGRLRFTVDPASAIAGAEVVFICVGTPPSDTGAANIEAVDRSAEAIGRFASGPIVVVQKSTVPAGTASRLRNDLAVARPDIAFHLVSNPEFLREGQAVHDSLEPDRLLVGADDEAGLEAMRRLYAPLVERGHALIETDVVTAELAKHACNAFLALKISYANALARICERIDADVVAVTGVMGADPRIGPAFLSAGLGYGGYCFPKDLAAFHEFAADLGYGFPMLAEIARINDEAIGAAIAKVREAVPELEGKRVCILGLAFKPDTDDTRLSPALEVARKLIELGAVVVGYDPAAGENARRELPALLIEDDPYRAAEGADALVLATAWSEFGELDLARLREVMAEPVIVDGRNIWEPARAAEAGFTYRPTGRKPADPCDP